MSQDIEKVISQFKNDFDNHIKDLATLVRIPSCAFERFDKAPMTQCLEALQTLFKRSGLENIQLLPVEGTFPYIYADHMHAPGKPTVLFYAHYDVQPAGNEALWKTPPFELTRGKSTEGDRYFGRGSADNKSAIIILTATISSYLRTLKSLPVNIKVFCEGEEEIGGMHFEDCLKLYKDKLKSDIIVINDSGGLDAGIPSITTSLRGACVFELELRGLTKSVHSGIFGGASTDVAMELSKMLASITDDLGRITIKEIANKIPAISNKEKAAINKLKFDEKIFRDQAGMLPSAAIPKIVDSPYEQIWRYPSFSVNALESSSKAQARNSLNDIAWARVGIRLAPGMEADEIAEIFIGHMKKITPKSCELTIKDLEKFQGWATDPFEGKHAPVMTAATNALKKGYGQDVDYIGCGASIPLVKLFEKAFNNPAQIVGGVMDPNANIHGENEGLLISEFDSGCKSTIYMLDEFSRIV